MPPGRSRSASRISKRTSTGSPRSVTAVGEYPLMSTRTRDGRTGRRSAIDVALWDLLGLHYEQPLAKLLGQVRDRVALYGSGINLNLSAEEVVEQVKEWKADGYAAGKVKVGKPDLEEDVYRLTKIREAVGEYPLMVDANQGWTYGEAVRAVTRFRDLNLYWVEEPLRVDASPPTPASGPARRSRSGWGRTSTRSSSSTSTSSPTRATSSRPTSDAWAASRPTWTSPPSAGRTTPR
ncbi:hypothetical protein CTI14_25750 [Methylobacterium radiotolerans]|nr:hypothetical protein CTI14_25750 [Methylobacterium radiotolerans]